MVENNAVKLDIILEQIYLLFLHSVAFDTHLIESRYALL